MTLFARVSVIFPFFVSFCNGQILATSSIRVNNDSDDNLPPDSAAQPAVRVTPFTWDALSETAWMEPTELLRPARYTQQIQGIEQTYTIRAAYVHNRQILDRKYKLHSTTRATYVHNRQISKQTDD